MKAMVIEKFGAPDVFVQRDIPVPPCPPGHLLIKVKGSSLNPIDAKLRSGLRPKMAPELPAVLHGDVAGVVADKGSDAGIFNIGDAVYGCAGGFRGLGGALAEYMVADEQLLARKPTSLSYPSAAAIPLVSITAWEAIVERAAIQPGERLLVHGSTGGVGHMAVQLAKWRGAHVTALASNPKKMELARSLGADHALNHLDDETPAVLDRCADGGYDVVLDTVGGKCLDESLRWAKPGGRVVSISTHSTHDLSLMHQKSLTLHVVFMCLPLLDGQGRKRHGAILGQLSGLLEKGLVRPVIDPEVFAFSNAAEAHRHFESRKHIGKITLSCDLG